MIEHLWWLLPEKVYSNIDFCLLAHRPVHSFKGNSTFKKLTNLNFSLLHLSNFLCLHVQLWLYNQIRKTLIRSPKPRLTNISGIYSAIGWNILEGLFSEKGHIFHKKAMIQISTGLMFFFLKFRNCKATNIFTPSWKFGGIYP